MNAIINNNYLSSDILLKDLAEKNNISVTLDNLKPYIQQTIEPYGIDINFLLELIQNKNNLINEDEQDTLISITGYLLNTHDVNVDSDKTDFLVQYLKNIVRFNSNNSTPLDNIKDLKQDQVLPYFLKYGNSIDFGSLDLESLRSINAVLAKSKQDFKQQLLKTNTTDNINIATSELDTAQPISSQLIANNISNLQQDVVTLQNISEKNIALSADDNTTPLSNLKANNPNLMYDTLVYNLLKSIDGRPVTMGIILQLARVLSVTGMMLNKTSVTYLATQAKLASDVNDYARLMQLLDKINNDQRFVFDNNLNDKIWDALFPYSNPAAYSYRDDLKPFIDKGWLDPNPDRSADHMKKITDRLALLNAELNNKNVSPQFPKFPIPNSYGPYPSKDDWNKYVKQEEDAYEQLKSNLEQMQKTDQANVDNSNKTMDTLITKSHVIPSVSGTNKK